MGQKRHSLVENHSFFHFSDGDTGGVWSVRQVSGPLWVIHISVSLLTPQQRNLTNEQRV